MTRDPPSRTLLYHLLPGPEFSSMSHHGLVETPLHAASPRLNLDETLVTEYAFHQLRRSEDAGFRAMVKSGTLYDIFHYAHSHTDGFSKFKAGKRVPKRFENAYAMQNPFGTKHTLGERLEAAEADDPDGIAKFRESLMAPAKIYVSQRHYNSAADKTGISPLPNHFFEGDAITKSTAYSREIARILTIIREKQGVQAK